MERLYRAELSILQHSVLHRITKEGNFTANMIFTKETYEPGGGDGAHLQF